MESLISRAFELNVSYRAKRPPIYPIINQYIHANTATTLYSTHATLASLTRVHKIASLSPAAGSPRGHGSLVFIQELLSFRKWYILPIDRLQDQGHAIHSLNGNTAAGQLSRHRPTSSEYSSLEAIRGPICRMRQKSLWLKYDHQNTQYGGHLGRGLADRDACDWRNRHHYKALDCTIKAPNKEKLYNNNTYHYLFYFYYIYLK